MQFLKVLIDDPRYQGSALVILLSVEKIVTVVPTYYQETEKGRFVAKATSPEEAKEKGYGMTLAVVDAQGMVYVPATEAAARWIASAWENAI